MKSSGTKGLVRLLVSALMLGGGAACGPGAEKPDATAQSSAAIYECACTYTSTEWRNTSYFTGWNVTLSLYAKRDCYNHAYCGQVQTVSHLNIAPGYGSGRTYATQMTSGSGAFLYYQQYYVPHNSNSSWVSYSEGSGWKSYNMSSCFAAASWWDNTIASPCVR